MEVVPVNVRDADDIKRAVAAFARAPNGGMIVTGSALAVFHRDLIIKLATEHRLPAVYYRRLFVSGGGLISYGPDLTDHFRKAAGYVDRILKGEKPADPPVSRLKTRRNEAGRRGGLGRGVVGRGVGRFKQLLRLVRISCCAADQGIRQE